MSTDKCWKYRNYELDSVSRYRHLHDLFFNQTSLSALKRRVLSRRYIPVALAPLLKMASG